MSDKKVVILGAGVAGLSAAWRLSENGVAVEVIEAAPELGGLAASIRKDGFVFDYGIHGWFASREGNEEVLENIKKISGLEWLPVRKKTHIYLKGKYLKYPLGLKGMFLELSRLKGILCLWDFLKAHLLLRLGFSTIRDASFKGWIINRFGRRLYNIYFGPYAQKFWGVDPANLSSGQLSRRVVAISVRGTMLNNLFRNLFPSLARAKEYSQQPEIFFCSRGGSCEVIEVIAKRIRESGGKIHLNSRPARLSLKGDLINEVIIDNSSGLRRICVDSAISTIPINELMGIISPRPREGIQKDADGLRYRSVIFLFLLLNKCSITNSQWIYYPDSRFLFSRMSEFRNISKSFAPHGKTGICLEIACFKNDNIWKSPNDELYRQCLDGLESLRLVRGEEVDSYFVRRIVHAYPLEEITTTDKTKRIFGYLKEIKNIYCSGRQGLFGYMNMDECVSESFRVADKILGKS